MTNPNEVQASKFLSLVLRHKPETIGLILDQNGWADTQELIQKVSAAKFKLTFERLKAIVDGNDKKRFAFSEDFTKIRANQGHSLPVELGLPAAMPPAKLYHGTALENIAAIKEQGLLKGQRHHVHLAADPETARKVGLRYGKPVVLTVAAAKMHQAGYLFYRAANNVWLTDWVKPEYLVFPA